MAFLGGLLIFLSILFLMSATGLCVAAVVLAGIEDVYWIAGAAWICALLLILTTLGAGIALCQAARLKKQVKDLQQLLMASGVPSAAPAYIPSAPVEEIPAVPGSFLQDNWVPPRRKSRAWIPVTVLLCILVLAGGAAAWLMLRPAAPAAPTLAVTEPPVPAVVATEPPVLGWPEETAAPEPEAPAAPVLTQQVSLGETFRTDFVEITFKDMVVDTDVKYAVTTGIVTRKSGPDPVPGQKYICLTGTIRNISNSALPVYDFFLGNFDLGGYQYAVDASDCGVLDGEGSLMSKIVPLMEYHFRVYLAIPEAMEVNPDQFAFTFGFYDLFDNQDLARSRSFSDNPISECPYRFTLVLN